MFVTGKKPNFWNKTVPVDLFPLVHLNTSEAYENLTAKSLAMLKYIYETTKLDEFDWLLKADDDTYVIVENLKLFLKNRCPNETNTYGFKIKQNGVVYLAGGGGYAISSQIVHKLGASLLNDSRYCEIVSGIEDIELAMCLKKLNVTQGDSRDRKGRERFHCYSFNDHWNGTERWIDKHAIYLPKYVCNFFIQKNFYTTVITKKLIIIN